MRLSNIISLYIKRRPYLNEVLREGIINFSALARKICHDLDLDNENAVKMALIRNSNKFEKQLIDIEGKILSALKKSSMTIKSKVAVIITSQKIEKINYLSFTQSGRYITYIVDEKELEKLSVKPKIEQNLNLIIIESPELVEEVPGFISHILGSLSKEGINIIEFISCYTDTLLVIKQADTEKAFKILSELTS